MPSELLGIEDCYTAYCFDEACAYILSRLEKGEQPVFTKTYTSFADMYKHYD